MEIGHKNALHLVKLQRIKGDKVSGTIPFIAVSSAMSTYVKREVVLMYFTKRGRIKAVQEEMQLSDWLKLSENRCARTTAGAMAAERIDEAPKNEP
jgi:hypothetical protein